MSKPRIQEARENHSKVLREIDVSITLYANDLILIQQEGVRTYLYE